MGPHARTAALATLALTTLGLLLALVPAHAYAAGIRAGAAEVDASWHVGASAGQYASDGTFVSDHGIDPNTHSVRRQPSYGRQSELKVRALVVEGPDGRRVAIVKNDLYLAQDLLHRRTAQLLEQAGTSGVTRETLTMAATHNHSSPYYSSPSFGVWVFQDVFDARFYDYYARKQAAAIEEAAAKLVPVRVGGSVSQFDKTNRNSIGGAIADDGTPAGYPSSDTDHDMTVVRFDDISDPANPKPLANLVNFPLHPEFLDGNDLISADYLAPLQRMADRETKALTILTQGSVGTAEPERSSYHSIHERLEFTHKEYGQAEYAARLMTNSIVDTWRDIERGTPEEPQRFAPFRSGDVPVGMRDKWYPGPFSHPYPGVSNCRTDQTLAGDPQVPIAGLPDCASAGRAFDETGTTPPEEIPDDPLAGANPGLNTDDFQRAGIPVPENYSAPSFGALEESLAIHLQALRIGDILFTVCACEQWKDQGDNIKTRTDRVEGNEYLGYDWSQQCTPNQGGTHGQGPEGYDPAATWDCVDPRNPAGPPLEDVSDGFLQRMRAQVNNPANGWNDLENTASAESEPTDLREIKGNFTHDDDARSAELGYRLTVAIGMANDYNGYIASYREYQRGDHYRKALTAWGPHSADYMATRLVTLGRLLQDPGEPLPRDQQQEENPVIQGKIAANNLTNDQRATAFGTQGAAAVAAYEAKLPDDGGEAEAVTQPPDVERFGAALFTWNGGSNYTDSPDVRVQRQVDGSWRDYADGSGEVPITLKFPQGEEVAAHETGSFRWEWTAHFEAFVAGFDLGDRPRATPPGGYRFVVRGERREGRARVPYEVVSDEFEVLPWSGVTVEDLRVENDGRVSFKVGPRSVQQVVGGGGPDISDEIGPIDYPDTYESPARFIDDERTFLRDPAAAASPDLIEWFCLHCSWRPWADAADAEEIELTFAGAGGGGEAVAARRAGDRWVSERPLASGESAYVGAGCARDAWGNFNGAASAVVGEPFGGGGGGGPATRSCSATAPGDGDGDGEPGDGDGGSGNGTPGGGSDGSGTRGDQGQRDGRSGDQRSDGQGQRGGDRWDGRRGRAREPRCARPTGRLRGRTLGAARLGGSRAANRRAFPRGRRPRRRVDRFCLTDGRHVRVGYPSSALLARMGSAQQRSLRGRAIFVASASRRYAAFGKRHGSSARGLRGRRFRVGRNVWVLRRARRATVLFKLRGGRVREVGLANRRLTATRPAAARFLRSFR